MAWTYEQKTGRLLDADGQLVATGYSGFGEGKNDPAKQTVPGVGPIPQGLYTVGVPYDSTTHGPFVMSLTPAASNQMFGRDGFLMHGDSKEHPGEASHGCVIMPRSIREEVWYFSDHRLQVVEGSNV